MTRATSSRGLKGFVEIVVGADGETDQHVGLVVAGGEHHDGHPPVGLDPPTHLEAVEARQQQVEHDEIGHEVVTALHRLGPVVTHVDVVADRFEASRDGGGDCWFVFDDKDLPHGDHRREPLVWETRGRCEDVVQTAAAERR